MAGLGNLDLKKLQNIKLTKEQQQSLALGVVLLFGLGYVYFALVLGPLNADIAKLQKTKSDKESTLQQAKELNSRMEEYTQRLARAQAGESFVARRLPPKSAQADSPAQLIRIMTQDMVYLRSFQPETAAAAKSEFEGLHKNVVNIELVSDFPRFAQFLARLSGEPVVYYIEELKIDSLTDVNFIWATVRATMKLVSYDDVGTATK